MSETPADAKTLAERMDRKAANLDHELYPDLLDHELYPDLVDLLCDGSDALEFLAARVAELEASQTLQTMDEERRRGEMRVLLQHLEAQNQRLSAELTDDEMYRLLHVDSNTNDASQQIKDAFNAVIERRKEKPMQDKCECNQIANTPEAHDPNVTHPVGNCFCSRCRDANLEVGNVERRKAGDK